MRKFQIRVQGAAEVGSLEKELEEAERLSSGLHQKVFQLRQHLAERGLQAPGMSAVVLPPEEARRLEMLVEQISSASARVQHLEGKPYSTQTPELMSSYVGRRDTSERHAMHTQ